MPFHHNITATEKYAVVLEFEGAPDPSNFYYIRGSNSNPYSSGKLYKYSSGNWINYDTHDFFFEVYSSGLGANSLYDKWVEYQVSNNKLIAADYKNIIGDKKLYLYCGYQDRLGFGESIQERYGMDWSVINSVIDYAICGYGYVNVTEYMAATMTALNGTPLVGGVKADEGYFTETYNYCSGGVMYAYFGEETDAGYILDIYKSKSKVVLNTIPDHFELQQNYPNPFNPSTTIKYQLPTSSNVTIKIYDILGREVTTLVDEFKTEGRYEVNFIASSLESGVYLYRLEAKDFIDVKKLILLK